MGSKQLQQIVFLYNHLQKTGAARMPWNVTLQFWSPDGPDWGLPCGSDTWAWSIVQRRPRVRSGKWQGTVRPCHSWRSGQCQCAQPNPVPSFRYTFFTCVLQLDGKKGLGNPRTKQLKAPLVSTALLWYHVLDAAGQKQVLQPSSTCTMKGDTQQHLDNIPGYIQLP